MGYDLRGVTNFRKTVIEPFGNLQRGRVVNLARDVDREATCRAARDIRACLFIGDER
jgi:hypothetical protein